MMPLNSRSASKKTIRLSASKALAVSFAVVLLLVNAPQARADYWGGAITATIMKQTMENIQASIQGAVLGTMKVAATEVINNQVNQLIGGNSLGEALIIRNFDEFLYQTPQQNTVLFMNDLFTLQTRGKASSANYISVGDVPGNVGGSYAQYLVERAKDATINFDIQSESTYTLDECSATPQLIVREGNYRCLNAYFSNPANNTYGFNLMAEDAFQTKIQQEVEKQKTIAQSSGFLPQRDNDGNIIAPAASIESITTNVKNMGNQIIAAANNPSELISGAVVSLVNKTVNGLVTQGVGKIQSNITREIRNVNSQVAGAVNSAVRSTGPAAGIINQALNQRTNVTVNPNTPAPPAPVTGP